MPFISHSVHVKIAPPGLKDSHKLHSNCKFGLVEEVTYLLASPAIDPNRRDQDFRTPLHIASSYGQLECARLLLKRGGKVNSQDKLGRCPLHYAVESGNFDLVKLLAVDYAANVNALTEIGSCPMHVAAGEGHAQILSLFVNKGAARFTQDKRAQGSYRLYGLRSSKRMKSAYQGLLRDDVKVARHHPLRVG
ncbi:hypothetical protein CYMTET_16239 [Cymbomonas tetramitiformis]|uniref:Uncharacterized protein n=1 Tax=Cymbomonas tetramitiformis TaxID=36881 RepID=A0AAE0L8D1_9CHLO|nr:hypothetical protein CYMTET_16239 [Cymbomonas tetramitiformis]